MGEIAAKRGSEMHKPPPPDVAGMYAQGSTVSAVAERFGVCRQTARSWKFLPDVQEEIRRLTVEVRQEVQALHLQAAVLAIETCTQIMREEEDAKARVAAARVILAGVRYDELGVVVHDETMSQADQARSILLAAATLLRDLGHTELAAGVESVRDSIASDVEIVDIQEAREAQEVQSEQA